MGWWWKSDPQAPVLHPTDPTPDPSPTPAEPPATAGDIADKPSPIAEPAQATSSTTTSNRTGLSPTDQADPDLRAFLAELSTSATDSRAESSTKTGAEEPAQPAGPTPHQRRLYPTTMSCRQAFDSAFYCQSLGGQFNGVYRYGGLRDCSEHWSDFWFCMRIKGRSGLEKESAVVEHYRQKEEKYRRGRSSEDVWEERGEGEMLKDAFAKDPDIVDVVGVGRRKEG